MNDKINLIHTADERLANAYLYAAENLTLYLSLHGRQNTAYDKAIFNLPLSIEHTPIMLECEEITKDGLKEVVAYIHATYLGKKEDALAALTGIEDWTSPEEDMWLYYGENNANNVMQLYGFYFTNYSFQPVDANSNNLVTREQLTGIVEAYNTEKYIKPVVEIDDERYWEMLECLPPKRWENHVFYMSEAQIGTIHAMFCQIGERYFEAKRDVDKTSNDDFHHECLMYIAKQEECETEKNAKNSD